MYGGKTVFSQVMDYLPGYHFEKCVARYRGDRRVRSLRCIEQFYSMAFAQLTYRESLRDIETCLKSRYAKLYHMGLRRGVSRSTLADANERRDWRIYADFAQVLIHKARRLYANDDFGVELDHVVYALDSTTIDLCLSLFPWAYFRRRKGAIKLHTLLDLRGCIPTFVYVTHGKTHDVSILDQILPEPGAFYVMDRAYIDCTRLYTIHTSQAFFVTRALKRQALRRLYSHPVDKQSGIRSDQIVVFTNPHPSKDYPDKLRRIRYYDAQKDMRLTFLTNNFTLPALTIAKLYKCRWRIELFFKWIKQHLRIKAFYGTSANAVKVQIWTAICVYLIVAIIKKQLDIHLSLYTILQILSVTIFEKTPLNQLLMQYTDPNDKGENCIQLNLFKL